MSYPILQSLVTSIEDFCDFAISENQRVFLSRLAQTAGEISPENRVEIANIRTNFTFELEELNCERICLCTEEILKSLKDQEKQSFLAKCEFNLVLA